MGIVPSEYGWFEADKVKIGACVTSPLLRKLNDDLLFSIGRLQYVDRLPDLPLKTVDEYLQKQDTRIADADDEGDAPLEEADFAGIDTIYANEQHVKSANRRVRTR